MLLALVALNLDQFKPSYLSSGNEFIILALYDEENPLNSLELELDKFKQSNKRLRFCKFDVSGESQLISQVKNELQIESLPIIVVLHKELGLYDYSTQLTRESINDLVESLKIQPTDEVYYEASELDLLDAYEHLNHTNSLILFVGNDCDQCQKAERHTRAVAKQYQMPLFIINCNAKRSENFCARKSIRHVPWVKLLADGMFHDYKYVNKEPPSYNNVKKVIDEVAETQQKSSEKDYGYSHELFTREYYRKFPTPKDSKGTYVEWPPRPELERLHEQVKALEKRVKELEKLIQE